MLLGSSTCYGQEAQTQDKAVSGPIMDRVTKRLHERVNKLEASERAMEAQRSRLSNLIEEFRRDREAQRAKDYKVMSGFLDRIGRERKGALNGLLSQMQRERDDRFKLFDLKIKDRQAGFLKLVKDASDERRGLIGKLKEASEARQKLRSEVNTVKEGRKGILQQLIDARKDAIEARAERGTLASRIMWALIMISIGLAVFGLVTVTTFSYLYSKIKPLLP